jgi:hypothetical protein
MRQKEFDDDSNTRGLGKDNSIVPPDTYQTSLVAFLDVLGMKEAVRRSVEKPNLAGKLENMLLGVQSRCVEVNKRQRRSSQIPNLKVRAFSDSIILTCPIVLNNPTASDNALRLIAVIISAYQMEVAVTHGFFIRGAITVGPHCERGDICFGPAFIETYEGERQLANWPRVIVLPKALELIAHGRHPYLKRDDAGITYVDYLLLCTANLVIRSSNTEKRHAGLHPFSWMSLIEDHKTSLEAAVKTLDMDTPQSLPTLYKYHSLAQYHNRYVRQVIRGGEGFPLTEVLELILSRQKGMTKDGMSREVSEFTHFFSRVDERLKACLVDIHHIFAPLRHRGPRST